MKMITNSNKMPAVIARMRNAFSRIFNHFCHAPTPDPTRTDCRLRGMAKSRSVRDEQQIFPRGSGPGAARRRNESKRGRGVAMRVKYEAVVRNRWFRSVSGQTEAARHRNELVHDRMVPTGSISTGSGLGVGGGPGSGFDAQMPVRGTRQCRKIRISRSASSRCSSL